MNSFNITCIIKKTYSDFSALLGGAQISFFANKEIEKNSRVKINKTFFISLKTKKLNTYKLTQRRQNKQRV